MFLTLTMDSLVWAMSEMTPSVMMRSTKYWDPSFTEAAYLQKENTHIWSRKKVLFLEHRNTNFNSVTV